MTTIHSAQGALFDSADLLPLGLAFEPAFIGVDEEQALIAMAATLPLHEARYKEYTARRRVYAYGSRFDFEEYKLQPTAIGELPPALIKAAPSDEQSAEIRVDGRVYQVQSLPLTGLAGQGTIAHVVMARPFDGVLSLFPGARLVFALTVFGALLLAATTYVSARRITQARI